jgi:hypothetical protein
MDDDSLYNTMIWALSIGIVVVIATLFLTRPAPESFTELYFLNHQSLPNYINSGERYNYTFVIHNLENQDKTYNYTISTQLYNIDYSCEVPELWLEKTNETYTTETNDITLLIKESEYAISTNYELRSGKKFTLKLLSLDNKEKYSIIIDHETGKATIQNKELNITPASKHALTLTVNQKNMTLKIDNESITVDTPDDYTLGFPSIESELIDFTGFTIQRNKIKQAVKIRYADETYKEVALNKGLDEGIIIVYSKYLANPLYDKLVTQPIVKTERYSNTLSSYQTSEPINITSFILKSSIRITPDAYVIIGLSDKLILHIGQSLLINNQPYEYNRLASNDIIINYKNNTAEIIINDVPIAKINATLENTIPYINAYNNANIVSFNVKGLSAPLSIAYTFPDKKQTSYAGVYKPSTIELLRNITAATGSITDTTQSITDLYTREKINWTNYILRTSYTSNIKNSTFIITYATPDNNLYNLAINSTDNTYTISYLENDTQIEKTGNITPYTINRVTIDVNNNTLRIFVNPNIIFNKKIQNTTNGMFLFDYSGATLISAQVEDRNSNKIKIFKKEINVECTPILLKTYIYNNIQSISDNGQATFNGFVDFNDQFDIAKVQVSLNDTQEIHFWTKRI